MPGPNTGFCDHLVEQIPPVTSWGSEALTVPLATRNSGDTYRILAARDSTTIVLEGASTESFTIGAGEFEIGSHTLTAPNPLGLYVYGYADYDSYGYPGGFSAPVTVP